MITLNKDFPSEILVDRALVVSLLFAALMRVQFWARYTKEHPNMHFLFAETLETFNRTNDLLKGSGLEFTAEFKTPDDVLSWCEPRWPFNQNRL